MEEYISEAPTIGSISNIKLDVEEEQSGDYFILEKDDEQTEDKQPFLVELKHDTELEPEAQLDIHVPSSISANKCNDLLGLNQINPQAHELDKSNAMALGLVQNGINPISSSIDWNEIIKKPGWELELVENNVDTNNPSQAKLDGGFEKLLLESLYEDDTSRRQIQQQDFGYNTSNGSDLQYNPFDQQPAPPLLQDPFMMSSGIPASVNVQMLMWHQQQHQQITIKQQSYQNGYPQLYHQTHQQQNMLIPYNNHNAMRTSNPFGDVFENPQGSTTLQGHHGLI